VRTKTSAAALQLDTGVSRDRGRKPLSKITWSSRLVVDAAGQAPAHRKKKIAKKPIGNDFFQSTTKPSVILLSPLCKSPFAYVPKLF